MKRLIVLILVLSIISCTNNRNNNEELNALKSELDSLKKMNTKSTNDMNEQIATFLTFQDNNAENAMNFYVELFDNSKIIEVQRWTVGGPVEEGKIMVAKFNLNGSLFMCSDSPPIHEWNFTPAVSNFINCKDEKELETLFSKLSDNGKVMMPLDNYGFSQKFGFVEDQFGVSWQLNLP